MAQIRLGRYETEEDALPGICMRCGAPAVRTRRTRFSWFPGWVWALLPMGLLPFVIVANVLMKNMTVPVPLCGAHKRHFLWRPLITGGGFFLIVLLVFGGLIAAAAISDYLGYRNNGGALFGVACPAGIVALLAWLVAAIVLWLIPIRPTEITDNAITLTGVSPAFVEALETERERWEEEEEYRPRRRARRERSENIYDPRPPRRRPAPPSDAYREGDE
jgi:hypothetical protein